jgi:hypothetical protein
MTLMTLGDVRELVGCHLPAECREQDTCKHVSAKMHKAARGGSVNDVVIALRLVAQLKQVPCLPRWGTLKCSRHWNANLELQLSHPVKEGDNGQRPISLP